MTQRSVSTLRLVVRRLLGPLSLALLLGPGLAGCAGTRDVRFHSLLPADGSADPAPTVAAPPLGLVIAGITVPAAVNQPQWLVRRPDNTLQALEEDRWASPLAEEFRAALRDGLRRHWGVVDGTAPLAATAPITASWRLVLEVLRLDARPAHDTVLDARWTLLPPRTGAASLSCDFGVREPVSGDGTVPLAQAHRRAVQRLTDDIGRQLRVVAGGGTGNCSSPRR